MWPIKIKRYIWFRVFIKSQFINIKTLQLILLKIPYCSVIIR
uniref:Uncharacterized protein n=1 Tax=CrAss-like virus sp. ctYsL76 TaxID=2826826 RepID=A0A8S5QN05_9CAUD|nr:MAG TPA: hypothetical protein [CrAss-like virus sp. ctYsL76]